MVYHIFRGMQSVRSHLNPWPTSETAETHNRPIENSTPASSRSPNAVAHPISDSSVNPGSSISNGEGYSCEYCGKMFAYQYYRDKHLKYTRCVDQGNRKYPCKLCSRSFEKRDRLRIHVLHVHEKRRPHKCHLCEKSFSQSSSLNKHLRVHSGERPYKCCYCNKAFTASSILRTHIRQHSGEKPFKNPDCSSFGDYHFSKSHWIKV
ncbi:unnamed protein product [Echinostoma caproni]|uniref:C2H2-type domain-containing protein n=1 Tax=Echinostoma caproni TaxID=27848 RepID=A0A3P8FP89_9TREM|nr:unnamed protein product [Echinostoma caproni]